MAAAMIMNSNSLPVALLQSLVVSVPGLERGQDDTINSIVGRAVTYISLSGTMGQIVSFLSLIVLNCSHFFFPDSLELRGSLTL